MEVLVFGIVREIVGTQKLTLPDTAGITDVAGLRRWFVQQYPKLEGLRSLAVAVNNAYADDALVLDGSEEIALIPPVSGG